MKRREFLKTCALPTTTTEAAPIANTLPKARLYINADGLSQDARLVAWAGRDNMNFPDAQFRVRIRFTGPSGPLAKFYAAYIE